MGSGHFPREDYGHQHSQGRQFNSHDKFGPVDWFSVIEGNCRILCHKIGILDNEKKCDLSIYDDSLAEWIADWYSLSVRVV